MLFNSYEFIFFFLPVTVLVFFVLGKRVHHKVAISWLVAASLFFYGWWNPAYLGLILFSLLFNYAIGVMLSARVGQASGKMLLFVGVAVNLGLIAYFKYANFFIDNINFMNQCINSINSKNFFRSNSITNNSKNCSAFFAKLFDNPSANEACCAKNSDRKLI